MSQIVIKAQVVEKTFERVKSGSSITGLVWAELDGQPYPYAEWYDFAAGVLHDWLHGSLTLAGGTVEYDTSFYDGPYSIGVRRERGQTIQGAILDFRCYNCDELDAKMPQTYHVRYYDYLEALISATTEFLSQLKAGGVTSINNREVRMLEKQLGEVIEFYEECKADDNREPEDPEELARIFA